MTVSAADDILRAGGNAVDAAVAAFFMSWVAEPCMSSGGGGAFAQVYAARRQETVLYDFFCQTPRKKRAVSEADFYSVTVDFGDTTEDFHIGKGSTGVPGAVAGAFALHTDFGSLPLSEIIQPAVAAAKNGVTVVPFQQHDFALLEPILATEAQGRKLFFRNEKLVQTGDTMYMPAFADFLEVLASEGKDLFYRGEIAQSIAEDYRSKGGFLTLADFENYEVLRKKPQRFAYRDYDISTNAAPAYGGLLLRKALQLLEKETLPHDLFSAAHFAILEKVFTEVEKYSRNPERLFGENRNIISPSRHGNTTHFSIVDKDGNAVALTASNGEGCGYFIENTDIQLNNMLGEAALLPAGFHSWQTDVRLPSMMSPTLVFDKMKKLCVVTGSSGAGRIVPAIAQSLHYILDGKMSVAEAVNAPRMHVAHGKTNAEPDWKNLRKNERLVRWKESSLFFGGVNAVTTFGGDLRAEADGRRDGAVSS